MGEEVGRFFKEGLVARFGGGLDTGMGALGVGLCSKSARFSEGRGWKDLVGNGIDSSTLIPSSKQRPTKCLSDMTISLQIFGGSIRKVRGRIGKEDGGRRKEEAGSRKDGF